MSADLAVYVGTYAEAGGEGLVPLRVAADGTLSPGPAYAAAANASFAALSQDCGLLYLVDEAAGMIGVHRNEEGEWHELARVPSGGEAPCYVVLDPSGQRLAVANYESGHAGLFELGRDGLPQGPPALFRSPGSGPVAERQEGPHAHCVRFADHGDALYLVDLGADRIMRLELEHGRFARPQLAYRAPAGSGPRHVLFHRERPVAILLSELASTLTLLELEPSGDLRPVQVISTLPDGFSGESLGGHLELSDGGDRVFVSNRGHNSVAVFALEFGARAQGELRLLQHLATGGEHPRHFKLFPAPGAAGKVAVVAHEQDGRVALFKVDDDGRWAAAGAPCEVPGACAIIG